MSKPVHQAFSECPQQTNKGIKWCGQCRDESAESSWEMGGKISVEYKICYKIVWYDYCVSAGFISLTFIQHNRNHVFEKGTASKHPFKLINAPF